MQHARALCPSPSPKVCPISCPLHYWCHLASSSSDIPFSFRPQSFPASATFPVRRLFTSDDQSTDQNTSILVINVTRYFFTSEVLCTVGRFVGLAITQRPVGMYSLALPLNSSSWWMPGFYFFTFLYFWLRFPFLLKTARSNIVSHICLLYLGWKKGWRTVITRYDPGKL